MTTENRNNGKNGRNQFDLTNPDNYENDYGLSWPDKIEKIYEIPDTKDMAGVIIRGIFKNTREANAILRLSRRHKKFNQDEHQELLRQKIASTAAIGGVRSLEVLFAATNLVAEGMYRIARGMPKAPKNQEDKVYRGSDFRTQERAPEGAERPR